MEKYKKISNKPQVRYFAIGGGVYLFECAVIAVLQGMGADALVAVGVSFWLGLIASFVLQKAVTFRDRRLHRQLLIAQIIAFGVLVLFNFGFTLLVAFLLSPFVPAWVARTFAIAITTVWNFYIYKTRIFKADSQHGIYW